MKIIQSGPDSWDIQELTSDELGALHVVSGSVTRSAREYSPKFSKLMDHLFHDFEAAEHEGIIPEEIWEKGFDNLGEVKLVGVSD